MTGYCPDQLDLPFALWGRKAVRALVRARFGGWLALRTVSDYQRRWGLTPQRPPIGI
jgi:transposase